jgi:hypothetical protein
MLTSMKQLYVLICGDIAIFADREKLTNILDRGEN